MGFNPLTLQELYLSAPVPIEDRTLNMKGWMIWHHRHWTVERRKFAARFRTYLGIQGCCKLQFTEYADSKIINNPNCNVLSLLFPGRRKARRGSGQSSVCCKRCSKAGRAWGWLQDCHQRWARRMWVTFVGSDETHLVGNLLLVAIRLIFLPSVT